MTAIAWSLFGLMAASLGVLSTVLFSGLSRFDGVNARIDGIGARMDDLGGRIDGLGTRIDGLGERLTRAGG